MGSGAAALWGSAVWGSSLWTGSISISREWRTAPDIYSGWKAMYLQTVSNAITVSYLGADLRLAPGTDF